MKYRILVCANVEHLERAVMDFCGRGWEPQGGVNYANENAYSGELYLQAMVKK